MVGADALLQAKMLGRMVGVDGVTLYSDTLTVATEWTVSRMLSSRKAGSAAVGLIIASFPACMVSWRRKLRQVFSRAAKLSPDPSDIWPGPMFVPMPAIQANTSLGDGSCVA